MTTSLRLLCLTLIGVLACAHRPPGLDEAGLIALRRQIHQHPELAGNESETARLVADRLRALGFEVRTNVGGHGVVGVLRGHRPGPVIAYRADMDAVASDEAALVPFRSRTPGAAHLCGHDVHVAVGLGIAEILAAQRDHLAGTLKLFFQPAEETLAGARAMIADGALADPAPSEIYAVHSAFVEVGTIWYTPGVGQGGLDHFDLVLPPGSHEVEALSRRIEALSTTRPPRDDAGFRMLLADLSAQPSPLADFVWIHDDVQDLTIRVFVRTAHDEAYERIRARVLALAPPGTRLVHSEPPFPGFASDAGLGEAAVAPLAGVVGRDHVVRATGYLPFFGDDFAVFLQHMPGAMFYLGVANRARGINGKTHAPDFQADERAIAIGARAMAAVLRARLTTGP